MNDDDSSDDGIESTVSNRRADVTYEIDDGELPSEAVVRAVASLTNTPILDLEPLHDVIDPDHLNGVFGDEDRDGAPVERSVTFGFNGCRITVTRNAVSARERDVE